MTLLRRRWVRIVAGTLVGVPAVSFGGLLAYSQYREATRPPDVVITPLVRPDGSMVVNDGVIAAPTKFEFIYRCAELVVVFSPVAIFYFFMKWHPGLYQRWLRWLLRTVEFAGPAFVKAGQWACTRSDLFGREFRDVFKRLFSQVQTHSFVDTEAIIESEFGKPLTEVFQKVDHEPIGSGSIGQVHRAWLKDGTKVAVKVMHPGVIREISMDFFIINGIAGFVERWVSGIEHLELKKQALAWTNHLAAQLDFRVEADNLMHFRRNFVDVDYVEFPEPLMFTQRVLVESYAEGEPATEEFLKSQTPLHREILCGKGLDSFCKMLLRDLFIHGDLHPGNILVDTKDRQIPHVYLIDVGLAQHLTKEEGRNANSLMASFVNWDAKQCSDALCSMGNDQKYCDKENLHGGLETLFNCFRPITGNEAHVIEDILQACFDEVRKNRLSMEPQYVNLLFATLVMESFLLALNPDYNIVRHTAPWLVSEGFFSPGLIKNWLHAKKELMLRHTFMTLDNKYEGTTGTRESTKRITELIPEKDEQVVATA